MVVFVDKNKDVIAGEMWDNRRYGVPDGGSVGMRKKLIVVAIVVEWEGTKKSHVGTGKRTMRFAGVVAEFSESCMMGHGTDHLLRRQWVGRGV